MVDASIKSNEREAARLFERGVAAARGGQRRVAAVLLARVVQLDPQHELGWLWLSGVLDEPKEIAFCLRSALTINPQNDRARRGLAWLEQRNLLRPEATATAGVVVPGRGSGMVVEPSCPVEAPAPVADVASRDNGAPARVSWHTRLSMVLPGSSLRQAHDDVQARHDGESWWVSWRHSRRELGRARVLLWSMPLLLLLLTLALNYALHAAIERNNALIEAELVQRAVAAEAPPPPVPDDPPVVAIIEPELTVVRDAATLAYLSQLEEPRARLRGAVESYRNATSRPGGSSIVHATSARRLRDEVERAYGVMVALQPPESLAEAHAAYLHGLELELAALDDMLAFYSSFRLENANRAALTMEEAGRRLERARLAFEQQQTMLTAQVVPVHSIR